MINKNRKNILESAKKSIQDRLWGNLEVLLEQRSKIIDVMDGEPSTEAQRESLAALNNKILKAEYEIKDWQQSSYSKKKKKIEWSSENGPSESRLSKPKRRIDWDIAADVVSEKRSIRKNNSSWLLEGVMVVHKNDRKRENPMMVIDIFNEGQSARLLSGAEVLTFRALSLRPAFTD
jgi:hypothetical protein